MSADTKMAVVFVVGSIITGAIFGVGGGHTSHDKRDAATTTHTQHVTP